MVSRNLRRATRSVPPSWSPFYANSLTSWDSQELSDGALRALHSLGDVRKRQPLDPGQEHDFAVIRAQGIEGRLQPIDALAAPRSLARRRIVAGSPALI
jgi:hypothetical protein